MKNVFYSNPNHLSLITHDVMLAILYDFFFLFYIPNTNKMSAYTYSFLVFCFIISRMPAPYWNATFLHDESIDSTNLILGKNNTWNI